MGLGVGVGGPSGSARIGATGGLCVTDVAGLSLAASQLSLFNALAFSVAPCHCLSLSLSAVPAGYGH